MPAIDRAQYWETAYAQGEEAVSWHQDSADTSLALIAEAAPDLTAPIIDIGGGSSHLVDDLLDAGRIDVTVLDLSQSALRIAQRRLGSRAEQVRWLAHDLLTWSPDRRYAIWHDRAVLHFLVERSDRLRYVQTLTDALVPGGLVVIGTFAPDGPQQCSGLEVRRYAVGDLMETLGSAFTLVRDAREQHTTPSGRRQPFTWIAASGVG